MPRISVIMGIYNCASTLQEALDSLYSQTYQDFEIILCDDGSTDDTYHIAMINKITHPNIVLLRNNKNLGLNQTLNNCLQVSKGDFIARMDGDDISMPNRFEIEIKFLEQHPEYAIVSSPMEYFDENGTFMRSVGTGEVFKKDFLIGSPIFHAPCMVRKEAYIKVGGYSIDKKLLRVEDYHLWFKMYAAGFKAYILKNPYYKMRDDRNAFKRRTWSNRMNECYVKNIGFKMIGIPWYYGLYTIKPIIIGLLPPFFYNFLHRLRYH